MHRVKEENHTCWSSEETRGKLLLAFESYPVMETIPTEHCEAVAQFPPVHVRFPPARVRFVLFFFVQTLLQHDKPAIGEERRVGQQESAMSRATNSIQPVTYCFVRGSTLLLSLERTKQMVI
jgi:hypothetical protein